MNKIKIICTLGPSTFKNDYLKKMKNLNVSLFRINMSHTSIPALKKILKKLIKLKISNICIDTEGAQIRTTKIKKPVILKKNEIVEIYCGSNKSNKKKIFLYPNFQLQKVKKNKTILIGFETLKLKKISNVKKGIKCRVIQSGELDSNKGVHINQKIKLNPFTKKDIEACKIASKYKVKHFALSFANIKNDVIIFRKLLGKNCFIISKIETRLGFKNRKDIIASSDAILIDRGDLSRYIDLSEIPIAQKMIANSANKQKKQFYIATNLLETMIKKNAPTRAESNDIFSSLDSNCSGLVLAAETAIGKFPIEAIEFIKSSINNYKKYKKMGIKKYSIKF